MLNDTVDDILNEMSPNQLIELRKEVDSRLENVKAQKIKELADAMKQWGISSSDLNEQAVKHGKLPMKYVNPDDANQKWSGKGKPPNWFKDSLAKGMSRTDLEIV